MSSAIFSLSDHMFPGWQNPLPSPSPHESVWRFLIYFYVTLSRYSYLPILNTSGGSGEAAITLFEAYSLGVLAQQVLRRLMVTFGILQKHSTFDLLASVFPRLRSPIAMLLVFAEAERFELSEGCPSHAFQACALDRYATPP